MLLSFYALDVFAGAEWLPTCEPARWTGNSGKAQGKCGCALKNGAGWIILRRLLGERMLNDARRQAVRRLSRTNRQPVANTTAPGSPRGHEPDSASVVKRSG